MRKLWPGLLVVVMATVFGFWIMGRLPAQVVTHWSASGEANGWASPLTAVLLLPGIALFMVTVLVVAPRIDPRRANFTMHSGAYWTVANVALTFIALVHVLALGVNLGWQIDLPRLIGGGMGILFVVMGNLLTRVRPNWVFGIRTPWTLSSEASWRETHRYGGYGFVLAGIATVVTAAAFPRALMVVMLGGIGLVTVFSLVWSYIAWKHDPKRGAST